MTICLPKGIVEVVAVKAPALLIASVNLRTDQTWWNRKAQRVEASMIPSYRHTAAFLSQAATVTLQPQGVTPRQPCHSDRMRDIHSAFGDCQRACCLGNTSATVTQPAQDSIGGN